MKKASREGFDNEVEKAILRGCSAANSGPRIRTPRKEKALHRKRGFHPYKNISAMGGGQFIALRIENPILNGEEGLQWRASITKWRKQPPAVAPLPNSGPRIRTPRKRESPLLKRASILIISFLQWVGSVHCFSGLKILILKGSGLQIQTNGMTRTSAGSGIQTSGMTRTSAGSEVGTLPMVETVQTPSLELSPKICSLS